MQHLRESSHLGISNSYISQNSKLRFGIVITPGNQSQKGPTVCLQSMESGIYGTFLGRSCKRTNKDVGTFCSSRALLTTWPATHSSRRVEYESLAVGQGRKRFENIVLEESCWNGRIWDKM